MEKFKFKLLLLIGILFCVVLLALGITTMVSGILYGLVIFKPEVSSLTLRHGTLIFQ